jgi:hypothetical protein
MYLENGLYRFRNLSNFRIKELAATQNTIHRSVEDAVQCSREHDRKTKSFSAKCKNPICAEHKKEPFQTAIKVNYQFRRAKDRRT